MIEDVLYAWRTQFNTTKTRQMSIFGKIAYVWKKLRFLTAPSDEKKIEFSPDLFVYFLNEFNNMIPTMIYKENVREEKNVFISTSINISSIYIYGFYRITFFFFNRRLTLVMRRSGWPARGGTYIMVWRTFMVVVQHTVVSACWVQTAAAMIVRVAARSSG